MWGTATHRIELNPGITRLSYSFDSLPLKPGHYSFLVSLFDDSQELDMWDAVPEMSVATESHQHPMDEWAGFLNLPTSLQIGSVNGTTGKIQQ